MSKKSSLRIHSAWFIWAMIIPQMILSILYGAWTGFLSGIYVIRTAFRELDRYEA